MTRALAALLLLLTVASAVAAQRPDTSRVDTVADPPVVPEVVTPQDTAAALPTTPRGALFRSVILPGWGQSKYEAYFRGGIYFAGWATNWFMLFRTAKRIDHAQGRLDVRTEQIRAELLAASPNPDSLAAQLDSFPSILRDSVRADEQGGELDKLVRAREQQQEDWIAWSLFWVLASGVDAYVTAHLSDFPAEVDLEPNADRSLTLRVGIPWPRQPIRPRPPIRAAPAPPAPRP